MQRVKPNDLGNWFWLTTIGRPIYTFESARRIELGYTIAIHPPTPPDKG